MSLTLFTDTNIIYAKKIAYCTWFPYLNYYQIGGGQSQNNVRMKDNKLPISAGIATSEQFGAIGTSPGCRVSISFSCVLSWFWDTTRA